MKLSAIPSTVWKAFCLRWNILEKINAKKEHDDLRGVGVLGLLVSMWGWILGARDRERIKTTWNISMGKKGFQFDLEEK